MDKLNEEIEVLQSIYDGEDVILKGPAITKNEEAEDDFAAFQSGTGKAFEYQQTPYHVPIELDIRPRTGGDQAKVGVYFKCNLSFNQFYPFNIPKLDFWLKGVDE